MIAQRRPAPKRMASSISATVATPSCTSHSASRHSASSSRSATKPSISLRSTQRPHADGACTRSAARAIVSGAVCSPAHDLDQRQQVDRVEGMADESRSGCVMSALRAAVGSRPEVDEPNTTSGSGGRGSTARAARASARSRSGALSCTKSTPATASSGVADERQRGPPAAAAPASACAYARRALSSTSPTLRAASGSGSYSAHVDAVEHEARRPAAADDAAAEQADARGSRDRLSRVAQPQLARARRPAPRTRGVHRLEDRDGALDELRRWWRARRATR